MDAPDASDSPAIARAADAAFDAVVVIAHGSRSAPANDAHLTMCTRLADRTGVPTFAAFLELSEPSLGAAVTAAESAGHRRLAVLPYFLYPGRHSRTDIPALVEAATADHPNLEIAMLDIFGDDPAVIDVLAAQMLR